MKRTTVITIGSDTDDEEYDEEEENESEEERRRDQVKSKLILDSLNPDLRERALGMLRQVEAGTLGRRPGGGNEIEEMSDDLRINTWNQVEVFAPVVAAAWHSKAARKSATAWQCIPVIPYAYARVQRHQRQSRPHRPGSYVLDRETPLLRSNSQNSSDEVSLGSIRERPGLSSRPDPYRGSSQQHRTQRLEVTRERNVRDISPLLLSKDSGGNVEERNPGKKIKSTEQALEEARQILKKREADRRKAAEKDAFEATLFRANAPPPKLFAAPSTLREQGLEEIARKERGRLDRTFDPNLTNPIDRHQRIINRTNTVSSWNDARKVPTWEERMDYLREQSPPRSHGLTLESDDNAFEINRGQTAPVDACRLFRRDSEGQGRIGSRNVGTLAERQQPHVLPQHQPRHSIRPPPPVTRPNLLSQSPSRFGEIRPAEAPFHSVPASAPRADWRKSEWMAQYQAQAADDPLAKFYGK